MLLPKIGIVVPVYKVKIKFLRMCIESLIKQSYKNLQIVLVDDCSPDDCGKICDLYEKQDERIKTIHHKQNRGCAEYRDR